MISGFDEERLSRSVEDLRADFKGARRICLFDKSYQNGKLHLNELVGLVAQKILSEEGHKKPKGKYQQVIDCSLSGVENRLKRVLPQVDAESSTECVEKGVQGVISHIKGIDSPAKVQSVYKKSGASKLKMQAASQSWGNYLLGLGQIVLGGSLALSGGIIELGSFGTLTIGAVPAIAAGCTMMSQGAVLAMSNAKGASSSMPKITDVYAPDRPLPRDPRTKEPVPEASAPHTELGMKEGTKEKYPQAREFDAQGNLIKDIDFTDHGRPKEHPNPHEHKWKPNPTGGTPERSKEAEPLSQ
jgi:hypothetical protein